MPAIRIDDQVWFDEDRKLEAICTRLSTKANDHNVLVLSHFEFAVSRLAGLLRGKGIGYERFSDSAALCVTPPGRVWLGDTRIFQAPSTLISQTGGTPLELLVVEHHPLQSRDQAIIEATEKLACESQLCFYFSLDDPVMRHFGTGAIQGLFKMLDLPRDECISHHLVTAAIRTAQEKIESKVRRDVPAHSAEDWFKYNLPNEK